jgi:hypothetical protein
MPWVKVEAFDRDPDGDEGELVTYRCDWPGCTNPAQAVLGCVREISACFALCAAHADTTAT